jgi:integrase/recombinase XerD
MRSYTAFNKKLARRYDDWMIAMHYAAQTRYKYRRSIQSFSDFMEHKSLAAVNHLDIRAFITRISKQGSSAQNAYQQLNVLRQFYDFLNLGGIVSYVPPRFVRLRRPSANLPPILSEQEVQRLIAARVTLRERAMVEFFYGTGCRMKEVTHLKVGDVDLVARTARVFGKRAKVRIVLLTEAAINAMTAYLAGRTSGFIFQQERPTPVGCVSLTEGCWKGFWTSYSRWGRKHGRQSRRLGNADLVSYDTARKKFDKILARANLIRSQLNQPLTNVGVAQMLNKIGVRAGLKKVNAHMIRRSFATHMSDHGAGIEIIQALLGHVYIQTTQRYTRLCTGRLVKTFTECHPRDRMDVS